MTDSVTVPARSSIEHLRASAAARVDNTSLRAVAREVGMSPTGLRKFLEGTAPYAPTLRRLRSWYIRFGGSAGGLVGVEEALAALSLLVQDLPAAERAAAADRAVETVAESFRNAGRPLPQWVSPLRPRLGELGAA
jgi:transcriptional regulator with XRE-family HTH domain